MLDYDLELSTVSRGYDGETCWVHARAGIIPPQAWPSARGTPLVVMTMQKLWLGGSDVFFDLNTLWTEDMGVSWLGPQEEPAFERRRFGDNLELTVCDFTPRWHAASQRLLGTGHTVYYRDRRIPPVRRRATAYSVFDPRVRRWQPWKELNMPDRPEFANAGAGSTQRCDLPDGDILLPIHFKRPEEQLFRATVVRCRFDGNVLTYIEHGDELSLDIPRGFCEPSLAKFGDHYFLTLRNDQRGYVTRSRDGLCFEVPRPWSFDDGEELGNYNTQQHWVVHSDALFLVYTRRGASNDHVFRHRAPLFMAQVEPERLCVIRRTERVIVPERGARLGNFGVTDVNPDQTWVTVAEWMQPRGCESYGSDNTIWVAKLHWNRTNQALV